MARVLETVLTGRDLLSPVLAKASGSVKAYEGTVTGSNAKQATSATSSAATQTAAASTVATAQTQSAAKIASASAAASAAHKRQADAIGAVQVAQARLTGLQSTGRATDAQLIAAREAVARAERGVVVAQEAVTATTARLAAANTGLAASTAPVAAGQGKVSTSSDKTTLSLKAQQAATNSLSASNGLLGSSLTPLTAGLGAVALGLGYAVFRGAAFDAAMSQVQASTMATGVELESLRQLAVTMGADTQYSGEEAAQGITELAKAGVSTSDILNGGLKGALDLAAAGQLEVGQAAEIAATQMVVFGLAGDQVSHVADLLAAGAGKAQGSVQDMGLALQYAGLPAAGLGLSIEETTGALGLFASNGLVGEKAGTAFRGMLVSMTNPAGRARETMNDLNLEFFDAQGQFIGMEGVAGQLQERLGGLTSEQRNAALATIFGNESLGAAQALYGGGAAGVELWTNNVNDAGYAAEQAGILNDNLRGDLEKLGGAFDSVMTVIGGLTQGALRFLVQGLTDVIDVGGDVLSWINDLPGPVQVAAAAVVAMYLATGPLAGVLLTAGSNMAGLAGRAAGAISSVGGLTGSLVAARTAVTGLVTAAAPLAIVAGLAYAVAEIVAFSNAGDDATESVKRMNSAIDKADGNTERFGNVTGSLDEVRDKINELSPFVESWSEENRSAFERAFIPVTSGVEDARESLQIYQDALDELEGKQERNGQNVEVLGRRYDMTRAQVEDFADAHGIDLSGSLQIVQGDFIRTAEAAGLAATGIDTASGSSLTGYESFTVYADALGLSEEAAEELRKKTDELGESLADFVEPLGAYTGLIDAKKEAERTSAEATAAATESQSDSWEDYVGDVSVSIDEYLAQLEEQVAAQDNWQTNMLILSSRVSQGTIDELARMGPEGAPLVAQLVDASDAELARMETVFGQRAADATSEWGLTLTQAQPVLSAIAATAGQDVANSLAAQLAAGTTTIAAIAAQYGIVLADGVNPVLTALGRQAVIPAAPRQVPGSPRPYATGGPVWGEGTATSDSIPAYLSNGEYVIKASSVSKYGIDSLNALNEGRALGVAAFAEGGFASVASVPKPRSTSPFAPPISSGADASMGAGYDEVVKFLSENALADAGFGGSKASPNGAGGLGPKAAAARAYVMANFGLTNIGGYANRKIAGTGTVSDHALGKAIDVMIPNYKSQQGISQGNAVASYFVANPGAFGTKYVIWRDQINSGRGWGPYGHPGGGRSDTLQHRDHVHVSVFANGGLVDGAPGSKDNPHVRDKGGPLLPGYTYNGLNHPEMVLPFAEGGMVQLGQVSDAAWDSLKQSGWKGRPGDGKEALYAPAAAQPGYGATTFSPVIYAQVRIGNTPLSGMVRAEINQSFDYAGSRA